MFKFFFYGGKLFVEMRVSKVGKDLVYMISIIICESEKNMRELYTKVVKKFLYDKQDYYKIYEFDKYNSEVQEKIDHIEGAKIYLLNIDNRQMRGITIARNLRTCGDFISPIILFTSKSRSEHFDKLQNILFLDLIKQDENLIKNLLLSMNSAYRIITRNSVFTFSIFDEVYRIPYNDIYYIQKNSNDDSVTIYTKDDTYLHYVTIKKLEISLLNDVRFFKAHRSCIINLYNVVSYDRKDNIITFNNGMTTSLIAKSNKNKLSKRLQEFSNSPFMEKI